MTGTTVDTAMYSGDEGLASLITILEDWQWIGAEAVHLLPSAPNGTARDGTRAPQQTVDVVDGMVVAGFEMI